MYELEAGRGPAPTPRDARRRIRIGVAMYGIILVALLLLAGWLAPTSEESGAATTIATATPARTDAG